MRNISFPLALVVSFCGLLEIPTVQANSCTVVAQVMQSVGKETGKGLCKNQSISFSSPVRVACTKVRRVIWIQTSADLDGCESSRRVDRPCSSIDQKSCSRKRGVFSQSRPRLLEPYGEMLVRPPKQIRWMAVPGADSYSVTVLGDKTKKFSTSQSVLNLPNLSSQSSIQFVIEAFARGNLLGSAVKTFNFLDPKEQRQVNDDLTLVKKLSLSPQQKDSVRLSIYANAGLIDSSIALVRQQILNHPGNPTNIRTLADIYLDAGLYEDAFIAYGRARIIALKVKNQDELQRAEEGLRTIATLEKDLERGAYKDSTTPIVRIAVGFAV
jgi:hypothetical protein